MSCVMENIDLLEIIKTAQKAGDEIRKVYASDFSVELKDDHSPLTLADKNAHAVIEEDLNRLYPQIPVLSEEGKDIPYVTRKDWEYFWLVDPLDGTKEYIETLKKEHGEVEMISAGSSLKYGEMVLNEAGKMIEKWWEKLSDKYDGIEIDEYCIMPNHIHGIIIVGAHPCVRPDINPRINPDQGRTHGFVKGRTHGSAPTVGTIIEWFKTMTANEYIRHVKNNHWPSFNKRQ